MNDQESYVNCECGAPLFLLPEPGSTADVPRYRVQHGPNREMLSPIFEGVQRSHAWRVQVHDYIEAKR